ncbi:MAG: DUF3443 family protein, partial [Candidatus Acidiferrales bacterium]
MTRNRVREFFVLALSAVLVLTVGCGSASSTSSSTTTPPPTGTNVQAISVNTGPAAADGDPYPNGAFTSVSVCVPGSTTQCQTIPGILIDTGSSGLRIQSSALTGLSLPQQVDSSNNAIVECGEFGSGFTWGPVQTVDLTISGEKASSVPIQVVGSANYPDTDPGGASTCSDGEAGTGADLNTLDHMGANGILGVGTSVQDCGASCTLAGPSNPGFYYSCATASTCAVTTEALSSQVLNPVVMFPTDNNGVIIELPGVASNTAVTSVNGYLIFGIGTETNNALGSATIYGVDPTTGNFTTVFEGETLTDASFLDSGSEVLFFDPATTALQQIECTLSGIVFYCPNPTVNLTATNEGINGTSGAINFTVGDP